MSSVLIRGGTVVNAESSIKADVLCEGGLIRAVGPDLQAPAGATIVDAGGALVIPGGIDPHTHMELPFMGTVTKDDFYSGTSAGVSGGTTMIIDFVIPGPQDSPLDAYRTWRGWAEKAAADYSFHVAVTSWSDRVREEMGELTRNHGVNSFKHFMAYKGAIMVDDGVLLNSFSRALELGAICSVHAENGDAVYHLQRRLLAEGITGPEGHALSRPPALEGEAAERAISLAQVVGAPLYIVHVSTAEELDYLHDYRDIATVEVLLNHLTQWAPDAYDRLGPYAVMNPPIRDRRHVDAAWAAVRDGLVDVVGSDHAPHSRAAKERPWPLCAAGLTGVQTIVPMMLDHVSAGRLSLSRLADLMCAGPARVYGVVGKGRIARGYDADFTLVDMKRRRRIEDSWIVSPCGWTPFAGTEVTGWPIATVIRGQMVMRDDEVLGQPAGRLTKFMG